jgi:hypothetical protein
MKSEFVPLADFYKVTAQQIETLQSLVELINGLVMVWLSTLPPEIQLSVAQSQLEERVRKVSESVAKLRSEFPEAVPAGIDGPIQ